MSTTIDPQPTTSARHRPRPGRRPGRRAAALAFGLGAGLVVTLGAVASAGAATTTGAARTSTTATRTTATRTTAARTTAARTTATRTTATRTTATRTTARATVPVPAVPAGLPSGIEDLAEYVKQVSCDPAPKPGTLALGRLLATTYAGTGYVIGENCGTESIASEHADGRAVDWMVSARSATGKAQTRAFLGWLFATDASGRAFAMARRLGVMYVIWDGRIWGAWDPLDGWQPYSTCASHPEVAADAVCRRDRMTLSLSWGGASARDSFWSKSVSAPDYGPCRPKDLNWAPAWTAPNRKRCTDYPVLTAAPGASAVLVDLVRFSGATVALDDAGPVVSAVQRALNLPADGEYGPYTADAVAAFQRQHGRTATGAMDASTWRDLLAVHAVSVPVDETSKTGTRSALTRYLTTVLRYNDRGGAVLALQKALKVTASAWFGPVTKAAVIALQKRKGLPATGVVDAATWRALGA